MLIHYSLSARVRISPVSVFCIPTYILGRACSCATLIIVIIIDGFIVHHHTSHHYHTNAHNGFYGTSSKDPPFVLLTFKHEQTTKVGTSLYSIKRSLGITVSSRLVIDLLLAWQEHARFLLIFFVGSSIKLDPKRKNTSFVLQNTRPLCSSNISVMITSNPLLLSAN